MMHGTLEPAGDQWRLRFTRHLQHAPDRVWQAVIAPEQRDRWFPQRIVGEWRVGAPLKFVSEFGDFEGQVLAYEPPWLVEFMWGTDVIRIEVTPEGSGTLLTLTDTFVERGKAARDAAGWHVCLDALEHGLAGSTPAWDSGSHWQAVHPRYIASFGPEAATIGPPERKPSASA